MNNEKCNLAGLTSAKAKQLQESFGKNELTPQKKQPFIKKVIHIILEPMFVLLMIASIIYFILGKPQDGAIMLIFVLAIICLDVFQEWKTDKTLHALKNLSAPQVTVIRDGIEQTIPSVDLVPGDLMLIYEGTKIPADGVILKCNDLCVDESSLTGEAEGIWKVDTDHVKPNNNPWRKDYCYAGTLATQGSATILVEKTGVSTEYGKIGANIASAPQTSTPLQKQTGKLVKLCAGIAAVLFALVSIITYLNLGELSFGNRFIESILSGITLAMAMIPEEFPVILTVFLSMGAWRLAKKKSLVRKLPYVETLGAISVLCVDKTGTITMNQMTVQETWTLCEEDNHALIETMGLGCETDAYDPMEKAMLTYCNDHNLSNEQLFSGHLVTEYAFTNELKMMGHVWEKDEGFIIAAKGSPERILTICNISEDEKDAVLQQVLQMSQEGLRVIAVATAKPQLKEEIPTSITDCSLTLLGLIGLADPPRESIKQDIATCNRAGIRVVMITGDNGITASSIAKKIGMEHSNEIISGDMLEAMSDEELIEQVKSANIFSRVVPEHKMRIVKALQENGEIVAMTGDGVNDAPALKHADIGIAMGKRGSEVSREAADLILLDDNFSTIIEAIKDGRRIYDNIRKAVGYVFSVHIPIALSSLLAPFLGFGASALFLMPAQIAVLQLLIDPTCSIVLERQPNESNIMDRPPRNTKEKLLNARIMLKSVIQGLIIFAASFGTYLFMLNGDPDNASLARSMGLVIMMFANLFLVLVNSSNKDFVFQSIANLAKDKIMWLVLVATVGMLSIILYTPINSFLSLIPLSAAQFFIALGLAAAAVFWFEIVKLIKKLTFKKRVFKTQVQ